MLYFRSRRLSSTPSDLKGARSLWDNALRVFLHQASGSHCNSRKGLWSQLRRRKNAAVLFGAHDCLPAWDPAARGRAVASGSREEAGIPRTRRASGKGGSKSEVRSLQVSPEGEGTRSSGAGTECSSELDQTGHIFRLYDLEHVARQLYASVSSPLKWGLVKPKTHLGALGTAPGTE